jgi:hypothetical protein
MARYASAMRVKKEDVDQLPIQDDSRLVTASAPSRFMLNHCRECGKYKWVYCDVDLGDGKGPGYICGRCRREARARKVPA